METYFDFKVSMCIFYLGYRMFDFGFANGRCPPTALSVHTAQSSESGFSELG